MSILVLCANYPGPKGKAALAYVKARNFDYHENGLEEIVVLNFSLSKGTYIDEGFKVISLDEYRRSYSRDDFNILISHAPNIRSHYRFLKEYQNRFKQIVFFFHGHEVLSINKEYPKPYPYLWKRGLTRLISPLYDCLKLCIIIS